MKRIPIAPLLLIAACATLAACSTRKNTAGTRFWQSFTTRYNVYYNGNEAYKEGMLAKEKGHKDNFTETLPFFMVGNESSRSLGKSNFETTITKCEKAIQLHSIKRRPAVSPGKRRSPKMKAYLKRQEFNPFLKNAWLLMGRAQFQKGDFVEAASTFSYITRHYAQEPDVVAEARIWLARCYSELEWFYDAEDALGKLGLDSVPARLRRERDATTANLLLRQGQAAEALPYLERAARKEPRKLQRARLYFLLGQVQQSLGHAEQAYRALKKCLRQSPPYEMAFNARILQTEVLADRNEGKKMIARLKRMARSANNKDYLDQVYYAMGNIYLSQRDTANAIGAYERGRAGSTRNGPEKGVLLLRLGELYWDRGRYELAQSCYGEAVGLIDKDNAAYDGAMLRSKVLDELVPYTSAVALQDSLLELSVMSEADRNAAIDRVIEALKKKEEEERRSRADSAADARAAGNAGTGGGSTMPGPANQPTPQGDKDSWYFYNPTAVAQGKQQFQRIWGKRKNEDNWRRANRSVLADAGNEEYDYEAQDSIDAANALADSLAQADGEEELATDSAQNDPHQREYYLKQIPFTEEAKQASNAIIMDGLYNAGLIEKDKLEDFPLAARTLTRLYRDYPTFEKLNDVYYQLFLLYSRWGRQTDAEKFRRLLAEQFPEDPMTRIITDPDFEHNARFGKEIEDSLYTATYEAYRRRDNAAVARNFERSTAQFPNGANRPKFILVHALSRIGTADAKEITAELRNLVKQYPESDVSEMAGLIVKGLESGRTLNSGGFDMGSLWARRTADAQAVVDSAGKRKALSPDRDVPFLCILAFPTDSLDAGQVLYDLAHFNFTGFMFRNFDISQQAEGGITQFRIAGFNNFEEAHTYAQELYAKSDIKRLMEHARLVLISAANLELLGTTYSFEDYKAFYDKTFAPVKLNPQLPLDLRDMPIEQHYEDEYTPEQLEEIEGDKDQPDNEDDGGEWYDIE